MRIWLLESNEKTFKNQCSTTLRKTFSRFRSHSDRLEILENEAFSGYFCLEKNKKVHVICKYGIDQIERKRSENFQKKSKDLKCVFFEIDRKCSKSDGFVGVFYWTFSNCLARYESQSP